MSNDDSIKEFIERFGLPDTARDEVERLIRIETMSSSMHRMPVSQTLGPDAPKPITLLPHQLFQTWTPDPDSVIAGDSILPSERPSMGSHGDSSQGERYRSVGELLDEISAGEEPDLPPRQAMSHVSSMPPVRSELLLDAVVLTDRFQDLGLIGTGGMGEVRRALDRDLNRVVALKIIRTELMRNARAVARFVEEAQTTGQLQHPGIVPVHEMGRLVDGRLYFTMLEVRGKGFDQIIKEYHSDPNRHDSVLRTALTMRRLIDIYLKVAEAVAYAHVRGVIHRDLKPSNVLVGEFGEVHVVDWGLAKILSRPDALADLDHAERVVTHRSKDESKATLAGTIAGTPAYMPLEQAMGLRDKQGPHSDVYALGATLYEVLTGRPPYVGDTAEHVLKQVLQGPPPVPEGPEIPEEMIDITLQAMERDPERRYPDGRALAESVAKWLDGAEKRDKALTLLSDARSNLVKSQRLRDRAKAVMREARSYLAELSPTDPVDVKQVGWQREEEARGLERGAGVLEVKVQQAARAALESVPNLPEAHAFLADYYRMRHAEAEARNDRAAEQFEMLLRTHDSGRYASYVQGTGALTLVTEPARAKVELYRYDQQDRRLVEVPTGEHLETPLTDHELPMGSYLLVLKAQYKPPVRYPVYIGRNEHWDGIPPGATEPEPIRIPSGSEVGEGEVYVPAGWFISGGDPLAGNSLPHRRVWVNGFICRRFPVTNREYIEFLDDLVQQRRQEDASRFAPRARGGTFGSEGPMVYGQDGNGLFYLQTDPDGNRWGRDWPVLLISWEGANAFASWRSVHDGLRWRQPTEYEWEKAARGTDGRAFPWGDYLDPTWLCMRESHTIVALPEPVDQHETDVSPYGIRGMGGNVRDWCRNYYTPAGPPLFEGRAVITPIHDPKNPVPYRAVRGGAWDGAVNDCRVSFRYGHVPDYRSHNLGFRIVRPYDPDAAKNQKW